MWRARFVRAGLVALAATVVCCGPAADPRESFLLGERSELSGAQLPDGRVVIAGGRAELYGPEVASVEIRGVDGVWSAGPSLDAGVAFAGVVALNDGRVLVAGGTRNGEPVADAWVSDAGLTRFERVPLPEPRAEHALVAVADGALLIGGVDATATPVATTFRFDAATSSWSTLAPMETARASAAAFALSDGRVIVVGGRSRTAPQASTEFLAADRSGWAAGPRLLAARAEFAAAIDENDTIAVVGGVGVQGFLESGEILRAQSGAWSAWARQPDVAIGACLYSADGDWWLMGGMRPVTGYAGIVRESILRAESQSSSFNVAGTLREGRYRPYCGRLADGSALLVGGATSRMRGIDSTDAVTLLPTSP